MSAENYFFSFSSSSSFSADMSIHARFVKCMSNIFSFKGGGGWVQNKYLYFFLSFIF